jgi:hypothetical protein
MITLKNRHGNHVFAPAGRQIREKAGDGTLPAIYIPLKQTAGPATGVLAI